LNLLRNISAHHGRLWNRLIVKRLPKIKKLNNLAPLSTWPSRMAVVMAEMPPEQQQAMGCPLGWQQQKIWI
jgi:hypothetical protein